MTKEKMEKVKELIYKMENKIYPYSIDNNDQENIELYKEIISMDKEKVRKCFQNFKDKWFLDFTDNDMIFFDYIFEDPENIIIKDLIKIPNGHKFDCEIINEEKNKEIQKICDDRRRMLMYARDINEEFYKKLVEKICNRYREKYENILNSLD